MSAGARSKGFHAFCRKFAPFMLRKCPGYNLHYKWDVDCRCEYPKIFRWVGKLGRWVEGREISAPATAERQEP